MSEKKELSDGTRAILAAALSLLVIIGYSLVYKPQPPSRNVTPPSAVQQNASGSQSSSSGKAAPAAPGKRAPEAEAVSVPSVKAANEQTVVIDSDLYHVELSNQGAVVRSWQLKKYTNSNTPPRPLDLVNAPVAQQTGGWPFSLLLPDADSESQANQALYVVSTPSGDRQTGTSASQVMLTAPAEVEFHWSDGHLEVTKDLKFDESYIVRLETTVKRDGQPVSHRVAWNGGFGDVSAFREAVQSLAFTGNAGSVTTITTKKLGAPSQPTKFAEQPGNFDSVGLEDLYFAAAFMPPAPPNAAPVPANMTISTKQLDHQIDQDGKTQHDFLPAMAAGESMAAPGPLDMRVFVGPKDIGLLKSLRPPLNKLVNFGWWGFIAEPLFYILSWLHRYVSNYGWDIVLMTIVINMVLYPLKVSSWRGMQKMQRAAPEIKQIQERYKKYSMKDPRKAEMNKEVMAVYSREGINPLGSCLPQVIQMPIWFGLYRMLESAIELRHAPWILWIHDLSGSDPHFILTILMGIAMYASQKMTPMTATDPSQQRMMTVMPLMFVGMFFFIPVSCGLIVYMLTQYIVSLGQQWHLNHTSPIKTPAAAGKGKNK